jgi:pimeloyl-ACP methyl ester carboxylesterase
VIGSPALVAVATFSSWRIQSIACSSDVVLQQLELLPGIGHTPWLEDAATVRQAVRRFIGNIATTASS